ARPGSMATLSSDRATRRPIGVRHAFRSWGRAWPCARGPARAAAADLPLWVGGGVHAPGLVDADDARTAIPACVLRARLRFCRLVTAGCDAPATADGRGHHGSGAGLAG